MLLKRASLPELPDAVDEVVAKSAEEEEQRILDTYEPAPLHQSDSGVVDTPDVVLCSCAIGPRRSTPLSSSKSQQLESRQKWDIDPV